MNNLDDLRLYAKLDPDGMLKAIRDFPRQLEAGLKLGMQSRLPQRYSQVNKIVVLGMGGSAIGGDLIGGLISKETACPVIVSRDYDLPGYVDEQTLVIASSYSGNTEETISAFTGALKTNAKKLVITTGGKLATIASKNHVPVILFDYKAQPRAVLGYNLGLLIGVFQKLGILENQSGAFGVAIKTLDDLSATLDATMPVTNNPAKQLAQKLVGKIVVTYGAQLFAEVAHRWKTQVNENSKAWGFYEAFSELNHNAVVGYEFPKELADKVCVVMLRAPSIHPRNLKRYELTGQMLEGAGVGYEVIDGQGDSILAQAMSLILLGDWVTYYLAILYGADPSPVKVISTLKDQLAKPA
ncbi:MAG: bifunctional phosphoglucose/phosphomannose isomerase [Chloroflexi bacterium]|jgi:glucose/mannose-6-phosphate isomerase|nr:bifunctional phosphoglucose/phosphomannose isomerase [Chloroflexota bacterium]MBT7080851.1 bifunctional phosphoglucose/phosphomannose isomerase [Chloroflexota bacterium]MBT7289702.1 bifunctional phosphoglucose/phosphomannose isomerase [Chloroflexota bacterium]